MARHNDFDVEVPNELLDGGNHMEDVSQQQLRRDWYATRDQILPRVTLFEKVMVQGLKRKTPKHW